jgi:putative Holliday junction resolvase
MLGQSDWVKLGAARAQLDLQVGGGLGAKVSPRPRQTARTALVRAAAIDLGAVRVGLAVADDLGLLAHPRPFLDGKNQHALLRRLKELKEEEQIELFVLGLPRELSGREGPAAKRARAFAKKLEEATSAKVELYDEWLSTREAAGRLRAQGLNAKQQRGRVDSAAAAILLQSWLDRVARRED